MKRTRLADRILPNYTKGEEIVNMVTHIVGAVFGIVALVMCVARAVKSGGAYDVVGCSVYGASLILLYTMSSIYHGLHPNLGKKVFQVIDHCTIYILISGTYTPIVLGPIRDMSPLTGWVIFGLVWGISSAALVFTAIDHNKYRTLSMICYIGIGWIIIFAMKTTIKAVTLPGFLYLLAGGIAYTVGAMFYGIGGRKHIRYMHSVFHVFVLLGTFLQFITIFCYCIPR